MNTWLSFLEGGLLNLGPWALVSVTLALTHVTIAAVTLYLHRSQAHRGLDLHPVVAHFFRFWLWLTTGMVTREWVAIHRKHHAKCEKDGDPHSPAVFGLAQVFFRGAELYREEARNAETLARYGHGAPDDWIERHLYSRTLLGVGLMLIVDLALFGVLGLTVWAVQMAWIPFWAAGVVNGLGHAWGYRNFACPDSSTNVVPWGLLIGGEELHNNHHAYGTSAKFSSRWYEFDLGWAYIRVLQALGLAQVRRVAPPPPGCACGRRKPPTRWGRISSRASSPIATKSWPAIRGWSRSPWRTNSKPSNCASGAVNGCCCGAAANGWCAIPPHWRPASRPRWTMPCRWPPRFRPWCRCAAN